MKRRLVKLVVFLLLGAIVNVAVAWGCALWSHQYLGPARLFEPSPDYFLWWTDSAPQSFPSKPGQTVRGSHQIGTDYLMMEAPSKRWSNSIAYNSFRWRSGLPTRSLERSYWMSFDIDSGTGFRHALILDPANKRSKVLPLRPIWPGFMINTLFYSLSLWMLFAAQFALRRWLRIRRELCPACAYPVGDSAVCTECGKPLIQQQAQTATADLPTTWRRKQK